MANRNMSSTWLSKNASSSEHELPLSLDRELWASKSAKISSLLKGNPKENINTLLQDFSANPEIIELVARFCHGFEINLASENVIPLICIAYYLDMTETHSSNNLLKKAVTLFEQKVLPNWNETIKAFRSLNGSMLQQAARIGLLDACLDSLVEKAKANPCLLGDPLIIKNSDEDSGDEKEGYRPNARRRLFVVLDWKSEDLSTLSLKLYQPVIRAMVEQGVQLQYVMASLCQYLEEWVFSSGDNMSIYKRNCQRDVIEVVEGLLPTEKGLVPCTLLFKMLRHAILLESSNDCRNGLESRIGKQLDHATVRDLLIPSQGYAKEMQYDIECLRRILKHFYSNYTCSENSGLIVVAELIEDFLVELASDIDLKIDTFIAFAEMSIAVSSGTQKNSDGIYRAIDIYLDKHRFLTELEREEVCKILDCHKMSPEAWEHAAKNERLPLRFVVQVLFVGQLRLQEHKDTVEKEVQLLDENLRREEEVRIEMEKMSIKVRELEKECLIMKKEIENNGCSNHKMIKTGKISMWKEMKRKLGCISSMNDCNCQVKKKKVLPK